MPVLSKNERKEKKREKVGFTLDKESGIVAY